MTGCSINRYARLTAARLNGALLNGARLNGARLNAAVFDLPSLPAH